MSFGKIAKTILGGIWNQLEDAAYAYMDDKDIYETSGFNALNDNYTGASNAQRIGMTAARWEAIQKLSDEHLKRIATSEKASDQDRRMSVAAYRNRHPK